MRQSTGGRLAGQRVFHSSSGPEAHVGGSGVNIIPQCQSCMPSWKSTHAVFVNTTSLVAIAAHIGIRRKQTDLLALRERAKLELC